ncbi:ADP-ribosylation factor family protein (macronuclear) [Tetrahymena thermophila SB210]|uniref:ADP-ribosylation factor family protein n=1 Tax=Tetrahymena thermophila (strain SB210) TaxID=312017 RepID=Q23WS0_TETTS|nr:ADP-ribosylation factor family protein [Tetrahymena thermophila SB210]EAS01025.1 ADP-ribosylation factor family protein [Tetrahymena thermophila SB210]|eukprot:XP_001021270.1 ADP-ribosylation factor family protein [Tetrahymena thermophila SB210]
MGQIFQKVQQQFKPKKIKLFMLGLWCSGKTTMLYRMKLGQVVRTIPTIGFNIEEIQYNDFVFEITESGGGDRIYPLFRHYMPGKDGMIVIVDSSDFSYQQLLQNTFKDCIDKIYVDKKIPVLILANKSDKCKYTDNEILQYVGVHDIENKIFYNIIHTNCMSGEGINQAFDWLYQTFSKQ